MAWKGLLTPWFEQLPRDLVLSKQDVIDIAIQSAPLPRPVKKVLYNSSPLINSIPSIPSVFSSSSYSPYSRISRFSKSFTYNRYKKFKGGIILWW